MTYEPKNQFEQFVVDKLSSIETLNQKQNGTLTTHDNKISNLDAWKNKITGGLIITDIILVPVVVTLIINSLK